MPWARFAALVALVAAPLCGIASAQPIAGRVIDQTGLPLPGVTIQVLDGSKVAATLTSGPDGTFTIPAETPGAFVAASLDGFETARVPRAEASTITLSIARAMETTTVVASTITAASPTAPVLGSTLTATNVSRLPSSRLKARESLPLLPSVVRGPDGLMQLGGARAQDTPLLLDGFNVTDPATGISSMNLPFEAVKGVQVLRDPMDVSYGQLLGGLVRLESQTGEEKRKIGVQGVVPRPRFASPGFGRLEGIFPRVHVSGPIAGGRMHYMTAVEYDFERIPVPDVTQGQGPDIVEQSATMFGRLDMKVNDRDDVTLEGLLFPSSTDSFNLSPRRDDEATPDVSATDMFAGITNRFVVDPTTVFTVQIGVLAHDAETNPKQSGTSYLSPSGWRGSWFSSVKRRAMRYTAAATWERIAMIAKRTHDFTLSGEVAARRLRGDVSESPVVVSDSLGRVVRRVDFAGPASLNASDRPVGLALRDVWQVSDRMQVDAGVRIDHSRHGGAAPSGRIGVRYAFDPDGVTVVKAGFGTFVGNVPLSVPAFEGFPTRTDRRIDPASGETIDEVVMQPGVQSLRLPRARAATIGIERQIAPGLDAQVSLTSRRSMHLPTLRVPVESGRLLATSTGTGGYRELQVSARKTLGHDQQIFVSYVRSSTRGELNDFAVQFHGMDQALLQPGGPSRALTDAPNRVLAWGTFNLPMRIVVSPVLEWRSGFPYSIVDERYLYAGTPNSERYPEFFATDFIVYKTFTKGKRSADFGIQLFNATNHFNPRDVYPVNADPRCRQFTNSVGPILRGYMLVKW